MACPARPPAAPCRADASRYNAGAALLVVLVIFFIVAGSSASFVWFMNQQQARAGLRYRTAAALAMAEAGVYRALSVLESVTPDDGAPGRTWRPTAYTEPMRVGAVEGRFTVGIVDSPGGAVDITSAGEVAGVVRRLRARASLASPAMLAALNGASFIRLERPPTAIVLLPYAEGMRDQPWIPIAAGRGIWLASSDVSVNQPLRDLAIGRGPLRLPAGAGALPKPPPIKIALAPDAELMLDPGQQRIDIRRLQALGVRIEDGVLRSAAFLPLPEVNREFFRVMAADNTANAQINRTAGEYVGDADLARKRDSLYSQREFEQLLRYLRAGQSPSPFQGVIYVQGRAALTEGQRMQIAEGALVAEGTVYITQGSTLEIEHSAITRTLPGIITLDHGAVVVTHGARLRVHGLVYASRAIDIGEGAHVDVVGSMLSNDHAMSFRNSAGTVVIRYDPAVLGTPGLLVPPYAAVIAWVSAWEELP